MTSSKQLGLEVSGTSDKSGQDSLVPFFFSFLLTTHIDQHKTFSVFAVRRPVQFLRLYVRHLPVFVLFFSLSFLLFSISNILFSIFHFFHVLLSPHPSLHIHILVLSHLTIIVPCTLLFHAHFVPSLVFFLPFSSHFFNMQTFQPVPLQPFTLDDLFFLFK